MNKRIKVRLAITAGVMLICVYLFAGFPPSMANVRQRIRLGLDLKGGTHLVLQVVTDDALRAEADQTIESLRTQLQRDMISFQQLTRAQNDEITVVGIDPNKDADFRRIVTDSHPEWDLSTFSGGAPNSYTIKLKPPAAEQYRVQAVDQAINTIRNRVDQKGIAEAVIQKHGGPGQNEILVQFPGVDDPASVKNIIRSTALLQFKIVEGTSAYPSQAAALQQYNGVLPGNLEILPSKERGADGTPSYYIVQRVAAITGRDLKAGAGGSGSRPGREWAPGCRFQPHC